MSALEPEGELKEEHRRDVFRALVEAEDFQDMPRPQAHRLIARRFGLSETQVRQIEREGMERLWPPL